MVNCYAMNILPSMLKLTGGGRWPSIGRQLSTAFGGASDQFILSETVDSCIRILTLNDEKRANCLSLNLLKNLQTAIKEVQESDQFRALIICGSGRFFSSGHDLQELKAGSSNKLKAEVFSVCCSVMEDLAELPIPSIAAVSGPALAAGLQLVSTCDLAVAGTGSTFSTPGVKLGLFCSTPAVPLIRAVGMRAAREMLLTGCTIDSKRAHEIGLVHRLVPDGQVLESAIELAREISQNSRAVTVLGKRTLDEQASMNLSDAYTLATQIMLQNLDLEDAKLGIDAFLNKRGTPEWTHKPN